MTRVFDPFAVGFDRLFDEVENLAKRTHKITYPPYNIRRAGNQYVIDMAVAGFKKEDITVELQKQTLVVKGLIGNPLEEEANNTVYLHKGIANRDFQHQFKIASNVEVKDAELKDGMLSILLEEYVPQEDKPLKIELKG
jgi:molecular chaperone IbpA